ncbi:MAG TPA: zinc ribbon domain-containing protein [Candidatus Brocadiia bacterium]|nr:transposase [Planctomycetota bacterium]MDO8093446.1 zinc ribbon domain-containing protein [Candidatus Brocadiales bacterium]
MANLLNYKFEIFPTDPQRAQLNRILYEGRRQWNKAVTIRKKLKTALLTGQIEHVINSCLSSDKSDNQGQRRKAILKFQGENFAGLDFNSVSRLYDIKNLVGKILEVDKRHLDINLLANELKEKYEKEIEERKRAEKDGVERDKLPKLKTYWQLLSAVNQYAGFAAKTFVDKSFKPPKGMSLSTVRFNVSGSKNARRWNQSVQPKKGQRAYGATGEPQYKRRAEGFAYQIQGKNINELLRSKKNPGNQIHITAVHKGNSWVNIAYHRPIPESSRIKELTVNAKAGRYFVVLTAEVPETVWTIPSMKKGWHAGIDPGAQTALTVALKNSKNGALRHLAIHYEFLEKNLDKLEKIQQSLSLKQGPRRKRTKEEIKEALSQYEKKRSVQKLTTEEREKAIVKENERLERRWIRQESSKRWRRWAKRVSAAQLKIANQRADVLHKISRALTEGCDVVGIGNWEPKREITYRKKLKLLKKEVRKGIEGAAEKLKAHQEEKSKQGPKGVKKMRRGGRDRSIATLRRLIEEKAKRASAYALTNIKEAGSTYTCCVCGKATGPKNDTSVREWRCNACDTLHHRDLNSGFNILKKTELEIAAAQAASPETGSTVTRTTAQGAMVQPVSVIGDGNHATEPSGRGGSFFYGHADTVLPDLWDKEVPEALKSLISMGVARRLTMQLETEMCSKTPT